LSLIELRASDNPITSLPDTIGRLTALRESPPPTPHLRSLPETVGSLMELRQIDLRGTPIDRLPLSLAALPRIEKIDLRWVNKIEAPNWFRDLEARGCVIYR